MAKKTPSANGDTVTTFIEALTRSGIEDHEIDTIAHNISSAEKNIRCEVIAVLAKEFHKAKQNLILADLANAEFSKLFYSNSDDRGVSLIRKFLDPTLRIADMGRNTQRELIRERQRLMLAYRIIMTRLSGEYKSIEQCANELFDIWLYKEINDRGYPSAHSIANELRLRLDELGLSSFVEKGKRGRKKSDAPDCTGAHRCHRTVRR